MQKKKVNRNKKFLKNAILWAETMEFGRKMMNLLWTPAHWPIRNRKAAQIYVNLNFGAKKGALKGKFRKKMPFKRSKRWNLAEKQLSSLGVLLIDPFTIKKLLKFVQIWISAQKKRAPKRKFSKKCDFGGRNDGIWPRNDEPPPEFCLLAHF